ncbi:transcriptional regulator [Salinarchaeum sp. Harcht-Bsk1]|uniref:helix-turn-helix domain-containing protein n=1 Tax=Salinarchaeum sp. Harcht-Bsk1 TaxID=1333523 RepID=UPI00034249DE|nr:helix-turn-helix domain-containing protein [Salinarchaeum sp. Harcht-Bsk1]AGN00429.1 transcriptional regulator [Salinarchaeum sp. Harcht-Bsk1]
MIDECLGVEVRIEGDGCPLADATRATGASVDARPPLLRADGNALLRFSGPARDDLADALDADDRIRYLYRSRTDDRHTFRCLSTRPCVVHDLISAGFLVDSLAYGPERTAVTGAVVGQDVLQGVMETAGETVGVELERVYPLGPEDDAPVARRWDLTPAQAESLRTATAMGYFTVPRRTTASEVADAMGISKTAFLERLHRAQHALCSQAFDVDAPPASGD